MITNSFIEETKKYIYSEFLNDTTGHDYFHIERVFKNVETICKEENADTNLALLAALLHDLGDYKLHNGIDRSKELITTYLASKNQPKEIIDRIIQIVSEVSFSKGLETTSIEAKIVQDADRLDAIGAIGIARCFAYGGSSGNALFNPYSNEKNSSSIQHFYDKLLLIKDLMKTETGKKIALERHNYMLKFLEQFYSEVK